MSHPHLSRGLEAWQESVNGESFNVGIPQGNFTVRDLAEAAQRAVPGSALVFTGEHGSDARTYRVSFNKISTVLKIIISPGGIWIAGEKSLSSFLRRCDSAKNTFGEDHAIACSKSGICGIRMKLLRIYDGRD